VITTKSTKATKKRETYSIVFAFVFFVSFVVD